MVGLPELCVPSSRLPPSRRSATRSSRSSTDHPLLIGEVLRPHGLRGEVVVEVLTDNMLRFEAGSVLNIGDRPEETTHIQVESSRPHGERKLVKFDGFDERKHAETLRGKLLFARPETTPPQDGFWGHQLLGAQVLDSTGALVGTITDVIVREIQDLWVVEQDGTKKLIPAVPAIVKDVNIEKGLVVIDPPPGLLSED